HQGGEALSSSAMARATTIPPTMKIRKAAGPSPTLKPAKSSPQARQAGAKVARPANSVRLPQRGQRPLSAAAAGAGGSVGGIGVLRYAVSTGSQVTLSACLGRQSKGRLRMSGFLPYPLIPSRD